MDFAQAFQLKLLSLHRCSSMLHHRKNQRRTFLVIRCEIWVVFHIVTNKCNCESVFVCVCARVSVGVVVDWHSGNLLHIVAVRCDVMSKSMESVRLRNSPSQLVASCLCDIGFFVLWAYSATKLWLVVTLNPGFMTSFSPFFCSILFVVGVIAIVSLFNLLWLLHRI